MPTYTYVCKSCHATQDVFHSISKNPQVKCLKCGKPRMARMMGKGAGVIFKGSGFYETDYKRSGAKSESKSESGSDTKSDSKSESKPESKSDAKSETKSEKKSESKGSKSESKSKSKGSDS